LNSKPNCSFVGRSMRLQQCKQSPSFDHFDSGFSSKWLGDDCELVTQNLISRSHRRSNSGSLAKFAAMWRASPRVRRAPYDLPVGPHSRPRAPRRASNRYRCVYPARSPFLPGFETFYRRIPAPL
jgi:hypothetical protein